jgi:ABC-type nickel/cobalt efflux system permease component RcnA
MKIFALCIGLGFGIFAIAVYAYAVKHRIKERSEKSGGKN